MARPFVVLLLHSFFRTTPSCSVSRKTFSVSKCIPTSRMKHPSSYVYSMYLKRTSHFLISIVDVPVVAAPICVTQSSAKRTGEASAPRTSQ